jgi:8-oxo-dGTP diphosphatase
MKNLLLLIIAIVLAIPFFILGFVYRMFSKGRSQYFRDVAESIDQLGNTIVGPLFEQWMLRGDRYSFGNIDETVSSVLGKNKVKGTLTKSGKFLTWLLNLFDKNHSIDAIEEEP